MNRKDVIKIELVVDHIYSTKEMCQFFNVSKDTWKKKKDNLLLHLQQYYEYEVGYSETDRRKLDYHIIKKIKDYEPPLGKKAKQNAIYSKQIIHVIEKDNCQTPKNVSRIIKNHNEIIALKHKESTIYNYARENMSAMFGKNVGQGGTMGIISEKIWCQLDKEHNAYIALDEEQIGYLYNTFHAFKEEIKQDDLSICADYDAGLITYEEMKEWISSSSLACFLQAKNKFAERYGFSPIKVPVYNLSAFCADT